jgi:hypothetical protein
MEHGGGRMPLRGQRAVPDLTSGRAGRPLPPVPGAALSAVPSTSDTLVATPPSTSDTSDPPTLPGIPAVTRARSQAQWRAWAPRRFGLVLVLLVLATTAGIAVMLLVGLDAAPASSVAEGTFAVRAFALNRFGFAAAHLPLLNGGGGALQVATYETVTGALARLDSPLLAAREAMVAASLLTGLALVVAARRLLLSTPATVLVLVLYGLTPLAALLHRTADPANLAALWLVAGLTVASGGARRPGSALAAVAYLTVAVLTAPVVGLALVPLLVGVLATGDVGRLPWPARAAIGGTGLVGYGVLAWLLHAGRMPGVDPAAAVPPLTGLDQVLLGVAGAAAVGGLAVRWLRPLAIAVLALGAALVFVPQGRLPLAVLALPLAALLVPAAMTAAGQRWRDREMSRARHAAVPASRRRLAVPSAVAVLAVLALGVAWVPAAGAARRGVAVDSALDQARDWVLGSLPTRPRIAVDSALWAKLLDAGYPAERMVSAGGLGLPSATDRPGWADLVFVVGRDAELLRAAPADEARLAREHSTVVAGWGVGADRVDARRVLLDPATALTQAVEDERSRAEAGAALTGNPSLELAPAAVVLLRRGDVDARLIAVLATIATQHRLGITTFPEVSGEDDRLPRRQLAIASIDGTPITPNSAAAEVLGQWLGAQQPPYQPAASVVTNVGGSTALLVSYDAVSQPGLLPP